MAEKTSEKMPTKGIRMPEEQWEMCQEKAKELGYHNPSEFVRDAIDFYVEWTNRESSEKFLTPALESVVRGIVKDSEDRNARLLFKMAVDINLITRIICSDFNYSEADLRRLRQESVRIVSDTNGTIHLGENTAAWHD